MILSVQNNIRQPKVQGSNPNSYVRELFKIEKGEHFLQKSESTATNQALQSIESQEECQMKIIDLRCPPLHISLDIPLSSLCTILASHEVNAANSPCTQKKCRQAEQLVAGETPNNDVTCEEVPHTRETILRGFNLITGPCNVPVSDMAVSSFGKGLCSYPKKTPTLEPMDMLQLMSEMEALPSLILKRIEVFIRCRIPGKPF